mgnify:CR=1 FL=1
MTAPERARWGRRLTAALLALLSLTLLAGSLRATSHADNSGLDVTPTALYYLPLVTVYRACPDSSTNDYVRGTAYQYDQDNPVRPAYDHADKNLELRGYVPASDPNLRRELIQYGCDDDKAPQLATVFKPARVPRITGLYQVHHWEWAESPDLGRRADPIAQPPVTALGLHAAPGETVYVPNSGYDIGGGMEVLVIFADQDTVALRYGREDSVGGPPRDYVPGGPGYVVHVDGICTDPNLLALYRDLDRPDGPRYVYVPPDRRPYTYPLPNLPSRHPIGTVPDGNVVVAVVDTGSFQDPRSLDEFWRVRPGYDRVSRYRTGQEVVE